MKMVEFQEFLIIIIWKCLVIKEEAEKLMELNLPDTIDILIFFHIQCLLIKD